MADKITVYTTGPSCGKCSMTKAMLKGKGVEFDEVDITQNPAAYEYVTAELKYTVAPSLSSTTKITGATSDPTTSTV